MWSAPARVRAAPGGCGRRSRSPPSLGPRSTSARRRAAILYRALLDVVRARNATHLVVGRVPGPSWSRPWRGPVGRVLTYQLLSRASGVTLHIVPAPQDRAARRRPSPRQERRPRWLPWAGSAALVAGVTALGHRDARRSPGRGGGHDLSRRRRRRGGAVGHRACAAGDGARRARLGLLLHPADLHGHDRQPA